MGVDFAGATPFWRAAYSLDVEAMRLLVRYGADPSIVSMSLWRSSPRQRSLGDGRSPRRRPARAAASRCQRRRLRHVASRAAASARARRLAPGRQVDFLEELGVDVNLRDADGFTALHHAAARGDNAMIQDPCQPGRRCHGRQSRRSDDRGHGKQSGAADAAIPGDDRASSRSDGRTRTTTTAAPASRLRARARLTCYRPFHCRSSSTATACLGFLCSNCSSTAIPSFERPALKWIFASVT